MLCTNLIYALEEYHINIQDHIFVPDVITVPADTKIKLFIHNLDPTPEEFESFDLHREKIVSGNKTIKISFGPLKSGNIYSFFGEFHPDTAQGKIIVK